MTNEELIEQLATARRDAEEADRIIPLDTETAEMLDTQIATTGRHCKTCRFLVADRSKLEAQCTFWVHFESSVSKPFAKIGGPIFQPTLILPRHVWDDLPTPPEMAALGLSFASDPWSESMDCPQWKPRENRK